MVWGMPLPSGPYGQEEGSFDHYHSGWSHRLSTYFLEEMPQAQKEFYGDAAIYRFSVSDKLIYECGRPGSEIVVTPIEDHEPPRFFQLDGDQYSRKFASIISLPGRVWAVDATVKSVIDWLEPGKHQFYPVELRTNKVYPVQYYVLIVGQWLESLDPDESIPEALESYIHGYKKDINGLALRESHHAGAHVWRERGLREWTLCFSDRLKLELAGTGTKLPKHFRMRSI